MKRIFALALLAAMLSGCTVALPLGAVPPPSVSAARSPLTVGIHYEPGFADYEYKSSGWGRDTFIFPIGPASVHLFDATIDQLFVKTERVERWPALAEDQADLDAVFTVRLEEFIDEYPRRDFITISTSISYTVEMTDGHGNPLAEWRVCGTGYGGVKSKGIYQVCSREGQGCHEGYLPGSTLFTGTGGTPVDVLIMPLILGSLAYDLSSDDFPPWKFALAGVVDLAMNTAAQNFSNEFRQNKKIQDWIAAQSPDQLEM